MDKPQIGFFYSCAESICSDAFLFIACNWGKKEIIKVDFDSQHASKEKEQLCLANSLKILVLTEHTCVFYIPVASLSYSIVNYSHKYYLTKFVNLIQCKFVRLIVARSFTNILTRLTTDSGYGLCFSSHYWVEHFCKAKPN